jgi:hypothetical protein
VVPPIVDDLRKDMPGAPENDQARPLGRSPKPGAYSLFPPFPGQFLLFSFHVSFPFDKVRGGVPKIFFSHSH